VIHLEQYRYHIVVKYKIEPELLVVHPVGTFKSSKFTGEMGERTGVFFNETVIQKTNNLLSIMNVVSNSDVSTFRPVVKTFSEQDIYMSSYMRGLFFPSSDIAGRILQTNFTESEKRYFIVLMLYLTTHLKSNSSDAHSNQPTVVIVSDRKASKFIASCRALFPHVRFLIFRSLASRGEYSIEHINSVLSQTLEYKRLYSFRKEYGLADKSAVHLYCISRNREIQDFLIQNIQPDTAMLAIEEDVQTNTLFYPGRLIRAPYTGRRDNLTFLFSKNPLDPKIMYNHAHIHNIIRYIAEYEKETVMYNNPFTRGNDYVFGDPNNYSTLFALYTFGIYCKRYSLDPRQYIEALYKKVLQKLV
jgi:hypothetical protein